MPVATENPGPSQRSLDFRFQVRGAAVGPEDDRRQRMIRGVQEEKTVGLRGQRDGLHVGQAALGAIAQLDDSPADRLAKIVGGQLDAAVLRGDDPRRDSALIDKATAAIEQRDLEIGRLEVDCQNLCHSPLLRRPGRPSAPPSDLNLFKNVILYHRITRPTLSERTRRVNEPGNATTTDVAIYCPEG